MQRCIGFGFRASELSDQAIHDFVRKNLPQDYADYIGDTFDKFVEFEDMTEEEREKAVSGIRDWIMSYNDDGYGYIADMVNFLEDDCVLSVPDGAEEFVCKEPDIFPCPDSKIRTREEFLSMISKYFDVRCGFLYEGEESCDEAWRPLEMVY